MSPDVLIIDTECAYMIDHSNHERPDVLLLDTIGERR